eukprot:gene10582-11726_t
MTTTTTTTYTPRQLDKDSFLGRLELLKEEVVKRCHGQEKNKQQVQQQNLLRRQLYVQLDLLKLDLEEHLEYFSTIPTTTDTTSSTSPTTTTTTTTTTSWQPSEKENQQYYQEIEDLQKSIPLLPIQHSLSEHVLFYHPFFLFLETCLRFLGVFCSIVFAGVFLSLPILCLRFYDLLQQHHPYYYLSEGLKKVIANTILYQAGLEVLVEGLDEKKKKELESYPIFITSFNHACNIDGFLVAGTGLVRQLAFGKKELFIVPFFSWLSLAIGGIPVDRGHRDRAIQALKLSVQSARDKVMGKDCHKDILTIAIAPEGTRSHSGQLLPFKKGAFYLWEDLPDAPILPMITYGAFELYHPKHWVNTTGLIVVRYLPFIPYDPTLSRPAQSRRVRRIFLEAIGGDNVPSDVGREISSFFKVSSLLANIAMIGLTWMTLRLFVSILCDGLGLSGRAAAWWSAMVTIGITVGLYIYYVYFIYWFNTTTTNNNKKKEKKV